MVLRPAISPMGTKYILIRLVRADVKQLTDGLARAGEVSNIFYG